jgi:hypothetical protein
MTEADGPAGGSEVRVSTIVGDRLCIRCGFNLTGQTVVREPHYSMLIVRCPECSTVAALQEYPALGRWAGRWAAVLAALWLLVLIGLVVGSGGLTFGFSMLAGDRFDDRYAAHIATVHNAWVRTLSEDDKANLAGGNSQWLGSQDDGPDSWVDSNWWSRQDPEALLRDVGGPIGGLEWRGLWSWPWLALVAMTLGALWAVVLLGQRRRKVMLAMMLPLAIAGFFAYISYQDQSSGWSGAQGVSRIASHRLAIVIMPAMLVSALPMMCLGILLGRPLVRGLARALLPPRMMGTLAFLWIADGKNPPRPCRER